MRYVILYLIKQASRQHVELQNWQAHDIRRLRLDRLTNAVWYFLGLTFQVSPYSWFGFTNIKKHRPFLNSHGVEVEILPFFLGGARDAAGNPFSPTPQWKQAFASQDSALTGQLLGITVVTPEIFPISSLFVS